MDLRTLIDRRRRAVIVAALVAVAVAAYFVARQFRTVSELSVIPIRDFYSVDDGQSWFLDKIDRITPFDHDGKPAVLVHLFTCDGGKTRFVGYLERLPEHALELYRATYQGAVNPNPEADDIAVTVGRLVKRKGDKEWVPASDPRYLDVVQVDCPDGGIPERVLAE